MDIPAMRSFKEDDRDIDGVSERGASSSTHSATMSPVSSCRSSRVTGRRSGSSTPAKKVGNQGRDGTEIDIIEKPWLDDRMHHALHWDGYGKEHRHQGRWPMRRRHGGLP